MKATGNRILIKPDAVEEVSKGGIVIAQNKRIVEASQMYGTVLDIGPACWEDYGRDEEGNIIPWCKVGDRIAWSQYAQRELQDPQDDEEKIYVVINDADVVSIIEEMKDE